MKPSKSALFEAAKRWDPAAVKALLKAAPELVGAKDPKGRQALHIACAVSAEPKLGDANGIATVTELLTAGADLEAIYALMAKRRSSTLRGPSGSKHLIY